MRPVIKLKKRCGDRLHEECVDSSAVLGCAYECLRELTGLGSAQPCQSQSSFTDEAWTPLVRSQNDSHS